MKRYTGRRQSSRYRAMQMQILHRGQMADSSSTRLLCVFLVAESDFLFTMPGFHQHISISIFAIILRKSLQCSQTRRDVTSFRTRVKEI